MIGLEVNSMVNNLADRAGDIVDAMVPVVEKIGMDSTN